MLQFGVCFYYLIMIFSKKILQKIIFVANVTEIEDLMLYTKATIYN